MATQKIKCPACGLDALLFMAQGTTALTVDSAKQIKVCDHYRTQLQANARRGAPLDCPAFREAMQRPASLNPHTPPLVNEAGSEGSRTKQAAAEEAADKKTARSRTSRRAEVKAEPASPRAKLARHRRKNTTSPRGANNGVSVVAD
jgi:phage protein D